MLLINWSRQNYLCRIDIKCCRFITHHHYTFAAAFLIIGRIIQGLSAACIMPSTLAIINEYYIGTRRQRALSYWSIGSWGGSGICTLFGGLMATYIGWRSIFVVSILLTLLAMYLIKHAPETKQNQSKV